MARGAVVIGVAFYRKEANLYRSFEVLQKKDGQEVDFIGANRYKSLLSFSFMNTRFTRTGTILLALVALSFGGNAFPQTAFGQAAGSSSSSASGMQLSVSDGRSTVRPGDTLFYVVTAKNTTADAKVVDVDLFLHAYANLISPGNAGQLAGNRIRWNSVTLNPNQSMEFSAQVSINPFIPDATELAVRAVVGGVEATDTTVATTAVQTGESAFQVSITDNAQTAPPNGTLQYVARVKNVSQATQTVNVQLATSQFTTIEDLVPDTAYDSSNISWQNVTFEPNQERTFTFKGVVRRGAPDYASIHTKISVGSASASDSTAVLRSTTSSSRSSVRSSSRSSRTGSAAPARSVFFSKTANASEILPGARIRYTLYVQNVLLEAIADAVITDRFDSQLLQVVDDAGATVLGPGQLQWRVPVLQPGETWQRTYILVVSEHLPNGTQIGNIATISGNDVAYAALHEKVVVVQTGVVGQLPSTGAAYDVMYLFLSGGLALSFAVAQRKRRL